MLVPARGWFRGRQEASWKSMMASEAPAHGHQPRDSLIFQRAWRPTTPAPKASAKGRTRLTCSSHLLGSCLRTRGTAPPALICAPRRSAPGFCRRSRRRRPCFAARRGRERLCIFVCHCSDLAAPSSLASLVAGVFWADLDGGPAARVSARKRVDFVRLACIGCVSSLLAELIEADWRDGLACCSEGRLDGPSRGWMSSVSTHTLG